VRGEKPNFKKAATGILKRDESGGFMIFMDWILHKSRKTKGFAQAWRTAFFLF
jgi:hypothetical protein